MKGCLVDTQFHITYEQQNEKILYEGESWKLGTLLEGHEFMSLILKNDP